MNFSSFDNRYNRIQGGTIRSGGRDCRFFSTEYEGLCSCKEPNDQRPRFDGQARDGHASRRPDRWAVHRGPAMIQRAQTPPPINLSRDPDDPPLLVDMEAFFELSFWLAEELEDLIANYRHSQLQGKCDLV